MFKQFQVNSVKENSSSVTISTEKPLYSIWMEILTKHFGIPENKGVNGNKFVAEDTCDEVPAKVYLTMYHTGKLLVQAEKNRHQINLHFVNIHLEKLFADVYSRKAFQKKLPNKLKTPITKPVKMSSRISQKIIKCSKCSFQAIDAVKLKRHKKEEHGFLTIKVTSSYNSCSCIFPFSTYCSIHSSG